MLGHWLDAQTRSTFVSQLFHNANDDTVLSAVTGFEQTLAGQFLPHQTILAAQARTGVPASRTALLCVVAALLLALLALDAKECVGDLQPVPQTPSSSSSRASGSTGPGAQLFLRRLPGVLPAGPAEHPVRAVATLEAQSDYLNDAAASTRPR